MAIATIVVLLFLFNSMMNVISMMDNFDSNSISTQEANMIIMFIQHVTTVMVRNRTGPSSAELQRTFFYGGSSGMDVGLFGTACPQPHLIVRPF
jgi:hypothetical protein